MKTYQVTGPVVSVDANTIVVKKGKDNWTIAKDASTKGADGGLGGLCLPDRADLSGDSPRIRSVGDADRVRRPPPRALENVVARRVGGGNARMVLALFELSDEH